MSDSAASTESIPVSWGDYLELTKPIVVALMILTSVIGMFLSVPGMVPWEILIFGNLGIALCAGSAAAVNHLVDQRIDLVMARTKDRPIAQGRLATRDAIIFALVLGVAGTAILWVWTNQLTVWLTLASLFGYAFVYTMYLKRATPQNIVIGGLAGAAPPLLGWTAVTNSLDPNGLLLALIIFVWTPPHFWALAIHRRDDYAKVGIPMLPVTHGIEFTRLNILLYTILLIIVSLLPFVVGMMGVLYLVGALVLGGGFLYWSIILYRGNNKLAPMETFKYSSIYLMTLFLVMLVDHYLFPQVVGV
ncbi:MAG: heme o synthase [Sinobacterium sp.]|jgi:protoheme IX farnesyltransferase|tara:strand:- start:400 stop:1311 length:912 start_codon:yes stop_codon:yes gene_type:complete